MNVLNAKNLREFYSRLPIRWKYTSALFIVVFSALILSVAGMAIMQKADFKEDIDEELQALANVIADNSTAALAFDDPESARETLSALRANPHIIAAAIYQHGVGLFTTYVRKGESFEFADDMKCLDKSEFVGANFTLMRMITLDNKTLGMVYLISDTDQLYEKLSRFLMLALGVVLVVFLGLYFLADATRRMLTGPIITVAETAKQISATRDYSVRLLKVNEDEIGVLVDGINQLLDTTETSLQLMLKYQNQFEIAVRGAGVGLWDINLLEQQYFLSPRLCHLLGYAPDELSSMDEIWNEMIHPDDKSRFDLAYENHRQSRKPLSIDLRLRTKQRDYNWFQIAADSFWNESGEHTRIAGSLADITEKEQAKERLNKFFAMSKDMICTASFDGHFLAVNPAFSETLGFTEDEFLNKPIHDFLHPEDMEQTSEIGMRLAETGGSAKHVSRFRDKDGNWHWLSWNSLSLVEERMIFAIARDETERRRDERKLQRYTEKLARSNRELQDFATIASHDLQEPLRKVQAFGDRLLTNARDKLDDRAKDYLDRMLGAVGRMKALINDLLNFSRVDTRGKQFEPVSLERIANDVLSDLEVLISTAEAEIELKDLPVIDADATQMRQLMQNLIGNAIKFRRADEKPRVKIQGSTEPHSPNGKLCRIEIEDNGIGFDEKYIDRIFTIFQRLHGRGEYEGTGVGLAVCRKIVERHQGEINACSVPGVGSKFTITLPIEQEDSEESV